ncbi:MAG: helix-turn-helix transcriptional regulator [Mycobacteriales bacterium]
MAQGDDRWVVLGEPQRRAVYEFVNEQHGPVTRSSVADALGITRTLAAFHLDKLLDAGLLEADFRRLGDRPGPGAGRPAKRYRTAGGEVNFSVPPRRYDIAGRILARAVAESVPGVPVSEQARRLAREEGLGTGARYRTEQGARRRNADQTLELAGEVLHELGYAPQRSTPSELLLRNCPFHRLVEIAPDLICGVNHAFLEGLLAGLAGSRAVHARLDPSVAGCCVVLAKNRRGGRPGRGRNVDPGQSEERRAATGR